MGRFLNIDVDVTYRELRHLGVVPAMELFFGALKQAWVGDGEDRETDVRAGTIHVDCNEHGTLRFEFVSRIKLPLSAQIELQDVYLKWREERVSSWNPEEEVKRAKELEERLGPEAALRVARQDSTDKVRLTDVELSTLSEEMFNAYNEQGPNPWQTFDGREVPRWPMLTRQVMAKWGAAAKKSFDFLKKKFLR